MEEQVSTRLESRQPDPLAAYTEELLAQANEKNVPSGILHWSFVRPYGIAEFDGAEWRGKCDQPSWMQFYSELQNGQKRDLGIASTDSLRESLRAYHERGDVPIAIAHYRYDTPKRTFVAKAIASAKKNKVMPAPAQADQILEQKRAFFSSALLPDHSHGFDLLPHVHYGLDASFVVPRALYLTNVEGEPRELEVDFDDGEGFRAVAFDETVKIHYGDDLPKQIRVRLTAGATTLGAAFGFRLNAVTAPNPNETWRLMSVEPYDGITAYGTAWVFYGAGHTAITDPMIFADGFGEGASNINTIWDLLDQHSLASSLRAAGKDLIILGYDRKEQYVQANALLAVDCIQRAIKSRVGKNPLVVAGGSMGGLVTRYALMWMESKGRDHEAARYFSYDTPHDGAWVPTILQYFAYYFENRSDAAKRMANLVRSAAAQQLLWGWVPTWNYSGPITNNPLRVKMNAELAALGGMPRRPRKYAVANGTGNGTGNGVPPGVPAFEWTGNACVGARPHTQPLPGENVYLGDMWLGVDWTKYYATNVPAFDSAPGGKGEFFGVAGDGAAGSGYGWTKINYRSTCFIPSVSALGTGRMTSPYTNISQLPPGSIPFDEYAWSSTNTNHVQVTAELAKWVLDRFGKAAAEAKPAKEKRPAASAIA